MSHRPVTLEWLREELGLYTQENPQTGRTQFERDKQDLIAAGVQVEVTGNRYRAVGEQTAVFLEDELDVLTRASGLVADPATGAALAAFAGRADAYPDLRHDDRVLEAVPEAPALAAAIADKRTVTFRYRPANGPAADRRVEPWALRARRGLWYVVGHDLDRDAHRHFRIDRIEGTVTDLGEAQQPRPAELPTDLLPGDSGPVVMQLDERGRFEARRLGATLDPADAGAEFVTAHFVDLRDETALGIALANDAKILEPEDLDRERRLRAQFVHDLHTLPPPDVPDDLARSGGSDPALDAARIRRLLALPGWLAERIDVTIEEATRAFGVDRGELEEDLDVLREVALPGVGDVVDTEVTDDGIINHVVAVTAPLHLDALDRGRVRSLLAATATLEPDRSDAIDGLVRRLDAPTVVAVDADAYADDLLVLRRARDERRVVEFLHSSRGGSGAERRRLTPTRTDWANGYPYVGGWDHDREAARWFRLDRITDVELGDVDPDDHDVNLGTIEYVPRGEEIEVVLRCTHVGSWVLSRLPPEHRADGPDGWTWAVVRTDAPELLADLVMVAGGEAEVVTPLSLREAIAERASAQH